MSDQLVIDIDSKSVDIATGSLKAFEDAVGQVERTLKSSGGISALDELKKALGNVGTAADSLKKSFAGSVGQLGRIFKNEMAELKSIVQETGLGVGRAAAKGIEEGIGGAAVAVKKAAKEVNDTLGIEFVQGIRNAAKTATAEAAKLGLAFSEIARSAEAGKTRAATAMKALEADLLKDELAYQTQVQTARKGMQADLLKDELAYQTQVKTARKGLHADLLKDELAYQTQVQTARKGLQADMLKDELAYQAQQKSLKDGLQADMLKDELAYQAQQKKMQEAYEADRLKDLMLAQARYENELKDAAKRQLEIDRHRVAAAMNAPSGDYQRYDPSSGLKGSVVKLEDPRKVDALGASFRKLTIDGNDLHSMARGLASGFNLLWLTWGNLVPLFIGAAISNGFIQTAKTGMQVAHTLETIAILGGNTAEEMAALNIELDRIGNSGPFGPLAVAESMKVLSLAGLKANEILAVTQEVLNFSIAGTTDLKTAADALVSISTAFGMGAAGFGRVSDVVSKAAAESKTSVESFANAMKTASVINKQYGVSLEDTATGIAALSQLGIEGTAAGTALRNMYADLSGRSIQVSKVLKAQGIEMRDTVTGGFRPMLEVVAELNTKLQGLDAIGQKNLLQAILSERGAKGIVELLQLINTEAKNAGTGMSNALQQMRKSIEESYGFAAISAAKLSQTADSQFKAVKATLETSMNDAYKSVEPTLRLIADALRKAFSSPEFVAGLSQMVTMTAQLALSFVELTRFIVEHQGAIAAAAAAYSLIAFAIRHKAAAMVASTAATTADTTATLANNAAKAGAVGALGTLGRLIPGLGTAITLAAGAWMAYDFWQGRSKDTATAASDLYNNNIIKNLNDEAKRLKELNDLRAKGLTLSEAQQLLNDQNSREKGIAPASDAVVEAIRNEYSAVQKLNKAKADQAMQTTREGAHKVTAAENALAVAKKATSTAKAQEAQVISDLADAQASVVKERKRDAEFLAAEAKKREELFKSGIKGFELGAGNSAERRTYQDTKIAIDNRLAEIVKGYNKEKEEARNAAADDKAMLDSKHRNGLISEGEYQSQLFNITKESEQRQLAQIKSARDEYSAIYQGRIKELADQWLEVKSRPTKNEADCRAQQDDLNKIADAWENLGNTATTEIEKMDSDARQLASKGMRDLAIASDNAAGAIYKLRKSERKYWADDKATLDKARALDAVNAKYRNLNDSVFSLDEANRAYEVAAAESTAKHEAHIEELTNSLNVAELAAQAFWDGAIGRGGFDTGEFARWLELKKVATDTGNAIADAKTKAGMSASAAGQAAFDRMRRQQNENLASDLSDAVMTGLVEGGEQGKTKLRDLLVKELQKPVKMVINLMMNATVNGIMGAVGLGGAGGAGSNPIGMASNAYSMYNAGSQAWTLGSQYMAGTMSGANVLGTTYANATGGGIDALLATNGAYGTAPAGAGWMGQLGTAGGVFAAITGLAAAFGAFREEVSVGGGLSGTFGSGDITGYDLRRESGYLFGGPDYTMVNPAQRIAELEAMRGKDTYLGGGDWGNGGTAEGALEQEIQRLKITYKDMIESQGAQSRALQTAYEVLRTSAGDMADSLGLGSDAVRKFTTTVGTDVIHPDTGGIGIKLDGLKPEEVQAKIQAALATASNELAQQVIGSWKTVTETVRNFAYEGFAFEDGIRLVETAPTVTQKSVYVASEFARDGEKAIDTLTRLSTSLTTVNAIWENLGYTMYEASLAGADAAGKMADAFGGPENMAAATGSYYENFYSDAEKAANVTRDITKALAKFGLEMPTTRAGYRALVEQQQKLGEAGTKSVVALMGLSGAFASITEQSSNLRDSLTEAYKEEVSRLEDLLKSYKAIGDNLLKLKEELTMGALSTATPAQKYEQARAVYEVTYQKALGGDVKAAEDFGNYASALLEQSRVMFASGSSYTSDFDKVLADIARIEDTNTGRVNDTQGLLNAANAQVTYLEGINSGVRTLVELIGDYSQQLTRSFGNTIAGDVITAYNEIGRSGFGTEVSQIDIAGFSHWLNVRKSTDSAGFFDLFGKAVASESYLVDDSSSMFGKSIPKFASGGYHSGGMRLVGENGPELEVTGPAMYYSSAQTAHLFGTAAQNSELAAELAALRQQVAELQEKLVEAVIDGAVMNARATEDNTRVVSNAVTETGSKSAYMENVKRKAQR